MKTAAFLAFHYISVIGGVILDILDSVGSVQVKEFNESLSNRRASA